MKVLEEANQRVGRPKANRETKKRFTFTIRSSVYEKAATIAYNQGKSSSELIENLLFDYINSNIIKD